MKKFQDVFWVAVASLLVSCRYHHSGMCLQVKLCASGNWVSVCYQYLWMSSFAWIFQIVTLKYISLSIFPIGAHSAALNNNGSYSFKSWCGEISTEYSTVIGSKPLSMKVCGLQISCKLEASINFLLNLFIILPLCVCDLYDFLAMVGLIGVLLLPSSRALIRLHDSFL